MPDTTTTNAPVGPPTWQRDPPSAEMRKPATIAQYKPDCGATPDEMANAIASGRATRPTVTPARRSATNASREYVLSSRTDFGSQSWFTNAR